MHGFYVNINVKKEMFLWLKLKHDPLLRLHEATSGSGVLAENQQPVQEDFPLKVTFPLRDAWCRVFSPKIEDIMISTLCCASHIGCTSCRLSICICFTVVAFRWITLNPLALWGNEKAVFKAWYCVTCCYHFHDSCLAVQSIFAFFANDA